MHLKSTTTFVLFCFFWHVQAAAQEILVIGREGSQCKDDTHCFNRIHPDIPMLARSEPGHTVVFKTRNTADMMLDPSSDYIDPRGPGVHIGAIHPMTGPLYVAGAEAGDMLAVTIIDIAPAAFGFTSITGSGLVSDRIFSPIFALWQLNRNYATTEAIPGVRIPNASFPGIITTLPDHTILQEMVAREFALAESGGEVNLPDGDNAVPEELCGSNALTAGECLRTFPPREHGGNMDIRYLGVGATIYLPCYIDGCGLAIGDLHFAQGDGEVAGTAIEMDADVTITTQLIKGQRALTRGPHYEGPARLLDIPSRRFYATTGFPFKEEGEVPPRMAYLLSDKVAGLENLSNDISLAARNALLEMIDYIVNQYGLTEDQAYLVASVAVDLRIGQVVDAPNVGVTAILPLDIFE